MGDAAQSIQDLERLFAGLPYNSIFVEPTHNWSGEFADRRIEDNNYEIKKARRRYFPCSHLWSSMVIRWNGDVVPCCRDLLSGIVLGNVNDESLSDIWNGKNLIALRKKQKEFRYHEIPICKNCSKLWEGKKPIHLLLKHVSKIQLKMKTKFKRKQPHKSISG